jgi:hypothetical protein
LLRWAGFVPRRLQFRKGNAPHAEIALTALIDTALIPPLHYAHTP